MSKVTFYLLEREAEATSQQPAHLALACQLAAQCFSNKQRCVVMCQSQAQAEQFDELLWQLPNDRFVPHNLTGEGPQAGTPVEICWQRPSQFNKPVLINLADNMPDFHSKFSRIFDFVPAADALKQQARERYKHYRAAGHQLDTLPSTELLNSLAGH
tara:strand:+ start:567 stop:1037 length:471 start_codon:yes stop_codon:yes gene_type:complete